MLPNFLVIGAPRSGTTWIDENLRCHPDVFMPARKELHFFDLHYQRGMAYYESLFSGWSGQTAVGECTPDYLHGVYSKNDVPALMHQALPDAKLIVCLRNPVERVYSRFLNSKAKNDHVAGVSFEEKMRTKPEMIREGFYYDHLMRFYQYYPVSQVRVLLYDDLRDYPESFMSNIYAFIGVDPAFHTSFERARINTAVGKKNLARSKLLWYLSRAFSRANFHNVSVKLKQFNSRPVADMSPEMRQWLADIYRESNEKLAKLIGKDLSAWD